MNTATAIPAALLAALCLVPAAMGDTYAFTVLNTSTATWSASFDAPFVISGTPRSTILGNYDATTNPTGTRTLTGLAGADNGLNNPINISAGGASASGNSGTNPLHPTGTFALSLNPLAGAVTASGLSIDLLNTSQITFAATVSVTYPSFRTRQPTCLLFGGFPINIPVGNAVITGLTAAQQPGAAIGTLTPTSPDHYDFTIPMIVDMAATATLNGVEQPVDPQPVPIVLTGTIVVSGGTATVTASTTIADVQSQPGPFTLDPLAFDDPVCTSHLVINVLLASIDTDISSTATLAANGTRTCISATALGQAQTHTVTEGQDTSFEFGSSGTGPLSFQWRKGTAVLQNGAGPLGTIFGATTSTLQIQGCTAAATGQYTCTVSNACGSGVSAPSTLTVNPPAGCDSIDFNGDTLFPDVQDITDFIGVFGGAPCPTGTCGDIDFNNDDLFPDIADIESLISVFGGGAC